MKRLITILLVEPENPDNIGAVARAMKNMGLGDLRLVSPPAGWRADAKKMAVSGYDVIESATEFKTVPEAIQDVELVIGTTRRERRYNPNRIPFTKALQKINSFAKKKKVAVMFGKESKGLDNDSLAHCDWITSIPSHPAYPSINLAQAVMIMCFSLYFKLGDSTPSEDRGRDGAFVTKSAVYDVLKMFQRALENLGYVEEPEILKRIMTTFHSLLKRAGLLKREEQMLKGLSRRILERVPYKTYQQIKTEAT